MLCSRCGYDVDDEAVYCPQCGFNPQDEYGAPVAAEQVPPAQYGTPVAAKQFPPVQYAASRMPEPYSKAGILARYGAAVVDGIIASALIGPAALLLVAATIDGRGQALALVAVVVGLLWYLVYSLGRDAFGRPSWGRQMVGQVVVSRDTGEPASFVATIVRQFVLQALNLLPGIGSLIEPTLVIVDADGRRLGDRATGTQVVAIAEVERRGHQVQRGKKLVAYLVLAAALVTSTVGGLVGGVRLVRAIERQGGGLESAIPMMPQQRDSQGSEGGEGDASATSSTGSELASGSGSVDTTGSAGTDPLDQIDEQVAFRTVQDMLKLLNAGDKESAQLLMTASFPQELDKHFGGRTPMAYTVEKSFRDVSSYVVAVDEVWPSGARRVFYFVGVAEGQPRVFDVKVQ